MICSHLEAVEMLEVATPDFLQFGPLFLHYSTNFFLCFELEQIRGHFYSWDPPMSVGKSGLGFALAHHIAEILQY